MRRDWIASLSLVWLCGGAAHALPFNPIDPSLPLNQYTQTTCISAGPGLPPVVSTGSCFGSRLVENPATLASVVGTGEAHADLATGTLRPHSIGRAYWFGVDQTRASGNAEAALYDTITFGGSYTGPVEIRLTIDGSFATTDTNPNVQGSEVRGLVRVISDAGTFLGADGIIVTQGNDGGVFLDLGNIAQTNANASGDFDAADVQFYVSVTVPITSTQRTIAFLVELETSAGLGFTSSVDQVKESNVDFGNTGRIAVIVPAGVTWTSGSGLLLVPEPGALALLGVGLAGLARLGRRARRA